MDKKLLNILRRKARGYRVKEVSEEFSVADGEQVLTKRKISEKHVAPDLAALKLLMEFDLDDADELTIEQMEAEKRRLIKLLQQPEPTAAAGYKANETDDG